MTRRHFVRLLAAGTLGVPLLKPKPKITYPIKITVGRNTRTVTHQESPHDFAQALEAAYFQAIQDLRRGIERLKCLSPPARRQKET